MDYLKEEIGWLKLLLVLVFTVSVSWTGWMVQNLSWPPIPRPWNGEESWNPWEMLDVDSQGSWGHMR